MSIQEARQALEETIEQEQGSRETLGQYVNRVLEAADAYAQARALAAHVDACEKYGGGAFGKSAVDCGDGWYCEVAKEIEQLGR